MGETGEDKHGLLSSELEKHAQDFFVISSSIFQVFWESEYFKIIVRYVAIILLVIVSCRITINR